MTQLPLAFADPIIVALISRDICISTLADGGLWATVRSASVEQLRGALELLPDELRRGRGPVLEFALRKLAN